MHWRRKWQRTPVFLPGESHGWGILVGCRLWGRTELDMTEVTQQQQLAYSQWMLGALPPTPSKMMTVPNVSKHNWSVCYV